MEVRGNANGPTFYIGYELLRRPSHPRPPQLAEPKAIRPRLPWMLEYGLGAARQ